MNCFLCRQRPPSEVPQLVVDRAVVCPKCQVSYSPYELEPEYTGWLAACREEMPKETHPFCQRPPLNQLSQRIEDLAIYLRVRPFIIGDGDH